jgi:hypothetical protein
MGCTECEKVSASLSSTSDLGSDTESALSRTPLRHGTSQFPTIIIVGDVDSIGGGNQASSTHDFLLSLLRRADELPNIKLFIPGQPNTELSDVVLPLRPKDEDINSSDVEIKEELGQYILWQHSSRKLVHSTPAVPGGSTDRPHMLESQTAGLKSPCSTVYQGGTAHGGSPGINLMRQTFEHSQSRRVKRTHEVTDTRTRTVFGWSAIEWIYWSIYLWIPGIYSQGIDDLVQAFDKCMLDIQQRLESHPDTLTRSQLNDLLPYELPLSSMTSHMQRYHNTWNCFRDTMMYAWSLAATVSIATVAYV